MVFWAILWLSMVQWHGDLIVALLEVWGNDLVIRFTIINHGIYLPVGNHLCDLYYNDSNSSQEHFWESHDSVWFCCFKQTGSITSVAFSAIRTEGCSDNHTITASGGGGTGFLAISRAVRLTLHCHAFFLTDIFQLNGQIYALEIQNHGAGYTTTPFLVSDDATCTCRGASASVPSRSIPCVSNAV